MSELMLENEAMEQTVADQKDQLRHYREIIVALQAELEESQRQNKRLQNHVASLKNDNHKLTIERNNLLESNTSLKSRNLSLIQRAKKLQHKLDNVTLWDLSEEAQAEAGHMLARDLLSR